MEVAYFYLAFMAGFFGMTCIASWIAEFFIW